MISLPSNDQDDIGAAQPRSVPTENNDDISRLKRLQREVFDELVGIKRRLTDVEQQGKRRTATRSLFASVVHHDGCSTETTVLLQGLLRKVADGLACSMRLLLDHPINPHQRITASLATRVADIPQHSTAMDATNSVTPDHQQGIVSIEQFHYHHRVHNATTVSVAVWQPVLSNSDICDTLSSCSALVDATACPHMRGHGPSGMALSVQGATDSEDWRVSSTTSWNALSGATHQQLHVVHAPHPRCTLATTASMLLPTAQQSTNNSNQHPRMCTLSCVSRFRVYDEISLSALLHTQQPWQLRIQSDADELGQQWGVTCSTREWQAAARCRVGNEAWWVTPVLCMRKLDTWHSEFSLMLDVEL